MHQAQRDIILSCPSHCSKAAKEDPHTLWAPSLSSRSWTHFKHALISCSIRCNMPVSKAYDFSCPVMALIMQFWRSAGLHRLTFILTQQVLFTAACHCPPGTNNDSPPCSSYTSHPWTALFNRNSFLGVLTSLHITGPWGCCPFHSDQTATCLTPSRTQTQVPNQPGTSCTCTDAWNVSTTGACEVHL